MRTCLPRIVLAGVALAISISAAASEPLRLPLTILRNNPVTTIEVGGREIAIGVDTGGGALGLAREVLTQAGAIELAGKTTAWTDVNGRSYVVPYFRVPEIRVAGRLFTDMKAIESQVSPEGPAVANVIGREFLRQFIVIIDYAGRAMTLLPPETSNARARKMGCTGTRVRLLETSDPGLAITPVELDGITLRLLWDTGASYSALSASTVAAHQLPVTPADGQKPRFFIPKRVTLAGSNLGQIDFVVLPLKLPDEFDGLVGYNVFTTHRVCLNFARSELRIR